jgi:NAD(P)-dependent dehydrogenase (short-subunit alcohol dehydrogenase family)
MGWAPRRVAHEPIFCSPNTPGPPSKSRAAVRSSPSPRSTAWWPRRSKAGYISAKHGVVGLTKVLALEGGPHGIRAVALCPGYVRTPLVEKQIPEQARAHGMDPDDVLREVILSPHAVKDLIEPSEVADAVSFLPTPAGRTFTGVALPMDMGWSAGDEADVVEK